MVHKGTSPSVAVMIDGAVYEFTTLEMDAIERGDLDAPTCVLRWVIKNQHEREKKLALKVSLAELGVVTVSKKKKTK